jgi:hypothetical protein
MAKTNEPKNFNTVNKLCCCMSMKTGMTILGWIELIISFFAVLVGVAQIIAHFFNPELDYLDINVEGLGVISKNGI